MCTANWQSSPDPRYVRVATGRDYRDAAPVTGISFGQSKQLLTVNVEVEEQARREAEESAKREAQQKAEREAAEQAKREAAEQAKREAAEKDK